MENFNASNKVAAISVCLDHASYLALTHFIEGVPGAVALANLDHYIAAEREIGRSLDLAHTRICFVDYDHNTEEAIWITQRLKSEYPEIHVFGVSSYPDPEAIITAMRAGCAEYLMKPLQPERIFEGLGRVESKQREKSRSKMRGKVITLVGAKGGSGVTSVALHLALELSQNGKRKALLVDQHPSLGDASLYLGTGRHHYSFYELASNRERLDEDLLKGFLLHHSSGLHLLDAPEAVDGIHGAPPSAIEHTVAFLAESYQFVVIDCPPGLNEGTLACIAASEQVAIVMTAELPSVRNAVRYIEHLSRLGYASSMIYIVLNRYSKKGSLSDDRIEKALGRPISLRVPNSYQEVIRAINSGAPIESGHRSDFTSAISKWAQTLSTQSTGSSNGTSAAAAAGAPSRGMRALFGR